MGKLNKIFTNLRVIIMLIFLVLSLIAIWPNPYNKGVAIRNVAVNSSAAMAGISTPKTASPMQREVIQYINNKPVQSIEDYDSLVKELKPDAAVTIKTDKNAYKLKVKPIIETITLNETELVVIPETIQENVTINSTIQLVNKTINKTVERQKIIQNIKGAENIGLSVYKAPTSNLRKGLDLEGGTRVLLQPERELTNDEVTTVIDSLKQRLNVYGLSDIMVRDTSDLSGNQYILVEIAGASEDEVLGLISQQGKFEAKIGNATVFVGGQNDITYVCKRADCSGIDPSTGCNKVTGGEVCGFRFAITLSDKAAQKQAEITKTLEVLNDGTDKYLSQDLDLYLDDKKVNQLKISADLKGKAATDIAITGFGNGATTQQAVENALKEMKELQTILITGSLPVKLNVAQVDSISPILGEEFIKNVLTIAIIALVGVGIIIGIRYRKLKITLPMIIVLTSEIIIILGAAAFIGWNLDLAAIAGIIITIGTGVDHLLIMTDETLGGSRGSDIVYDWKKKLKIAFGIILGTFFTTAVAMLPLIFAGAGMLRGFAITTLIGITIGVFITRPTYGAVVEILIKE